MSGIGKLLVDTKNNRTTQIIIIWYSVDRSIVVTDCDCATSPILKYEL